MVRNLRIAQAPLATGADTESVYKLHSSDSGKTWRVLDISCVDSHWITEVYPPYDGQPPIPGLDPGM